MLPKNPEPKHILHSGIFHPLLRNWQSPHVSLRPENLMLPLFIGDVEEPTPLPSLPGINKYAPIHLHAALTPWVAKGLASVLLFGVANLTKDEVGSNADSTKNPVLAAVKHLRTCFPNLVIACDVCLCAYTSHGHCGILKNGAIDNAASIDRIAQIALAYAQAGAHIVAPSDMMDGRVAAIKRALAAGGLANRVAVLAYSAKFASGLYGPFRDVSNSAPTSGDRKCYQLPPGSAGLARRAIARDIAEGCDMLMVKPGLAYLDIVRQTKDSHPEYPLFVYQVSGEYAMLHHGAQAGCLDLHSVLQEVVLSMRRAGADCIITYYTPLLLEWISKSKL